MRLENHVALVTGAASGIGKEIARTFLLFFAAFDSNALTGQSLVVGHGWFMQ